MFKCLYNYVADKYTYIKYLNDFCIYATATKIITATKANVLVH